MPSNETISYIKIGDNEYPIDSISVGGKSINEIQDKLVSGVNIKTINDLTLLGSGNIDAETTSNKVTSISSTSTDTQYPSAKCVYTLIGDIESVLDAIINGT